MPEPSAPNTPTLSHEASALWRQAGYDYARLQAREGKFDSAVSAYARIENEYQNDPVFTKDQGKTLTASCKRENVQKAVGILEGLTEMEPESADAWSSLGQALGRAGKYTRCRRAYQKALSIDPTNEKASLIAVPDGDEPLASRQKARAEELHQRGRQMLYAKRKPLEALEYYEAALALVGEAQEPWSLFDKGKALAELGHTDEAVQALQQARFLMPDATWPLSQLGIVYEKAGKLELAQALFYDALEKDNGNQEAITGLTRLGVSYELMKQLDKAREVLREAQKREKGNTEAARRLESIGNVNDVGLLDWSEHPKRRSPTLRILPEAELDERYETERYIGTFAEEYRDELKHLDANIGQPMDENCRAAIVIPAYHEGRVITRSLGHFLNQTDKDGKPLDPSLFEIVIVDNHPADKPKDNTEDEIRSFQAEHPSMRISYIHKVWGNNDGCVGNARRYGLDLAAMRGLARPSATGELFLVNNDADIYGINPTYVTTIIDEFDKNPKIDAITGKWTLPEQYLRNPNLKASQRLKYILDLVVMANYIPGKDGRPLNPPKLQGKSSAFRTSIYSAIGGMNQYATLAEDLEMGWMIRGARNWDGATQKFISGRSMEMISDPRRFLAVMAEGKPLSEMYEGFHENTQVREMDNDQLFQSLPKEFDRAILEREATALWQKQASEYSSQRHDMYSFFAKTMGIMGIDFEIVDQRGPNGETQSQIRIINTTRLERSLQHGDLVTAEEAESATETGETTPFPSKEKAEKIIRERQERAHQLREEGKSVLEIRQILDNDYNVLENYYRERVGTDLITDPYESAEHGVTITKKCSVVLPTYNRGEQLRRSLMALQESSFNAKYPQNLEVIVIDDGSPKEDVAQIVKDMGLTDLTVKVYRQSNGRVGKARYSGVLRATGDVVIITDPDVVYTPTMVEEYMKRHEVIEGAAFFGLRTDIDMADDRISLEAIASGELTQLPYSFDTDSRVKKDAMADSGWLKQAGHNTTLPMDTNPSDTDNQDWYIWNLSSAAWGLSISAPRDALLTTRAGHDERFVGYGFDDENLVSSLIAEGLYVIPNTGGLAYHQRHDATIDPEKREVNREIFLENINSSPRRQSAAAPEETDASLVFEIVNSRTEQKNPPKIEADDYKRAWTLARMGLYDKALAQFEEALPSKENDYWFIHDYSTTLTATCSRENVQKAVTLLEKITEINPNETWVQSSLAVAYGRAGEYDKARQAYETALRIYPDNHQANIITDASTDPGAAASSLHEKGARLFLDRGKPREALRYLEASLALVGEDRQPWAVFDKGKALFQLGLHEEALMQFQRSAELLPNETWPYSQLGNVYEAMGDKERAKSYYEQALSRWPENNESRQGLARVQAA